MTTVLLEGVNLSGAPTLEEMRTATRARRAPVFRLWQELRTAGRPTRETLALLKASHPRVAAAWGSWATGNPPPGPGQFAGLPSADAGAFAAILSSVPDADKARAYYSNLDEIHATDNVGRERAWAAMIDLLTPIVRVNVQGDATRAQVEEVALRIGLAADASGQSITPDRKLAEFPGARHASWMGGQIGYGGIGSWENLRAQAKQYLDQGFQWAEIFGRWSDPPNARTLGNDSGAYPYLPTWMQPIAAQAWKNRRMIAVENGSFDGHAAHAEQRSRSWSSQMEPVTVQESAVGSAQVANAVIQAGTAARPVQLAVADPVYMAPWEKAPTPAPAAMPAPFADRPIPSQGTAAMMNADVDPLVLSLDLGAGAIPYMAPIVDHAPPPVADERPVPIAAHPNAVDPKTGIPVTSTATAANAPIPSGTVAVPGMSPVPIGAQSLGVNLSSQLSPAMLQAMQGGSGLVMPPEGVSWFDQQMIPGVKNLYLALGAAGLLAVLLISKRGGHD